MSLKKKIVVLDGYTLNPGDLSWSGLEKIGDCTVYDRIAVEDILTCSQNAEILLTNKTVLTADMIHALPALEYIGVLATGFNIVDVDAARECNIPVTNIPTYGTDSVAQMVFAHILNFTQRVDQHNRTVRSGRWTACPDFCYWDFPLIELAGLKLGIVGFGRIGRRTAGIAKAFGMQVIAYDVFPIEDRGGVDVVDLETVFRDSDIISLHCPLTPETHCVVNRERLALMKSSAYLVNTSRGPLIDADALADALNHDRIAGAGLDVLEVEPPTDDNPLLMAKNCWITPHISWATRAARTRMMSTAVDNLTAFLAGDPRNVVNSVQ